MYRISESRVCSLDAVPGHPIKPWSGPFPTMNQGVSCPGILASAASLNQNNGTSDLEVLCMLRSSVGATLTVILQPFDFMLFFSCKGDVDA